MGSFEMGSVFVTAFFPKRDDFQFILGVACVGTLSLSVPE